MTVMARSMLVLGAMAAAGLVAAAVVGFAGLPFLAHLGAALGSTLLLLLSHSWVLIYLAGCQRLLRPVGGDATSPVLPDWRRRVLPWTLAAILLAAALFLVGGGVYIHTQPAWLHQLLFWLALVAQGGALWQESRALAANDRRLAQLDARQAA
jgi:hypothetical protein